MSTYTTNFLRRTLAWLAAGIALATTSPALAQGTVTLTGTAGNTCTYTQMTVQPNGTIQVACSGSTSPQTATFSLSHASSSTNYVIAPSTASSATVARSGGPAEALMVTYSVSGTGCSPSSGGIMLLAGQSQTIPFSVGAAGTSCTVTIGPPSGHAASPNSLTFTAQTSSGGGGGGVTPPANCPTIPGSSIAGNPIVNNFESNDELRMPSGAIGYYAVPPSPTASVIVEFSQGQQASTPLSPVTEFQVSKCPGVFDPPGHTIASQCKYRNDQINLNGLKIWTAPTSGYPTQDALPPGNCLAPLSGGPYYINVRWTYPSCQYGSGCGFSMRWIKHYSNSPF